MSCESIVIGPLFCTSIPESDCDCHIDMNLRYLPFDESLVRDLIIATN